MGKLLYLEPIGGIAGDMFLASCIDLGLAPADIEAPLRSLGVTGWRFAVSRVEVNGMSCTHLDVKVEGQQETERHLTDILSLIEKSKLPVRAKEAARSVFDAIGRAESKVHGIPLERIHFHEVGAIDSIVDICGAAVSLELLGWPSLVSAPPALGQGTVKTAHGTLPIPPPAVLELMRGKPVEMGGPQGEAVTPTGAGILAALAEIPTRAPRFAPDKIGYGAGTARWADRPNVLRATLGESGGGEQLCVLETNLDDCSGQLIAYAIERLLEAGALDAWAAPITMKKGRPAFLLGAIANLADRARIAEVMLTETTALGVRHHAIERDILAREHLAVKTAYGEVRIKIGRSGDRIANAAPEFEDCAKLAKASGVPLKEVLAAALAAFRNR